MKTVLRILHLEDDPHDAALIQATLEANDIFCEVTCVQTEEAFVAALERSDFELILSDFSMPNFDGLTALEIARTRWPTIPFIIVSGTMGEERAVDSLKSGATDYVLKGRLARLAPAVRRAMQDVDERAGRRRLEAQFIEAQKMEVIGHLAGGAAHDFNNMLAVIMGYSDLLKLGLGPDNPLQKHNERIRQAANRAAGLTVQLLVFSRKETVKPVVLNLNDVVQELDEMLRRLINERIKLAVHLEEKIGCIMADSGYMGQVLMNLIVNARDAMPDGGQLTITTVNVTLDKKIPRGTHSSAKPGDYVMLSVQDTGTGMTEEVKAHLFEAFFTTKPLGKGTGLGLATCHTIVQQSGGHINLRSEVGQGTTFEIFFPRVEPPVQAAVLPRNTKGTFLTAGAGQK